MKKIKNILLFTILISMVTASCKKSFSDLNQNENKPTEVPPALLFNGVLVSLHDEPGGDDEIYSQYYIYNYDYYGNNRYDFGSGANYYNTLANVIKMEEAALKAGNPAENGYSALGKFFRAYLFTKMSLQMGDIPMTQALQGSANLKPAYDAQKQVFKTSLALLDSANTSIAKLITSGQTNLSGDIFYNNDLSKWQKAINTFKLRLLIHLSNKVSTDADLNIAQQFATIYGDKSKYPIFTSSDDNFQYKFVAPTNFYPDNPANYGFNGGRKNTSLTHIGLLSSLNDPRTFVVAEPALLQLSCPITKIKLVPGLVANDTAIVVVKYKDLYAANQKFSIKGSGNAGFDTLNATILSIKDSTSFTYLVPKGLSAIDYTTNSNPPAVTRSQTDVNAFSGADPGLDLGIMYANATSGYFSFLNRKRYYSTFTAEPAIQVGYIEMCFNIAEAANRGWISTSAEDWYQKGIKASLDFYGIPLSGGFTAYFYKPGSTDVSNSSNYDARVINFDYTTYYAQPTVKYASDNSVALKQILKQKYIALFRQSGLESYYNFRRTGVPTFTTGTGTGNSGRIALRFRYPGSEQSANTENYNSAIGTQFGGIDDINGKMWLIK